MSTFWPPNRSTSMQRGRPYLDGSRRSAIINPCAQAASPEALPRPLPDRAQAAYQVSGHTLLDGTILKHEKSAQRVAHKRSILPSDIVSRQAVLGIGIPEPTSQFRLRAARSGGEVRQLAVWQLRHRVLASARAAVPAGPWPATGATWASVSIGAGDPGRAASDRRLPRRFTL
jgi:hypothetical protein